MSFTVEDIKKLRETTGAGMMKAKAALEASDGDMDKAVQYLRERGEATAAKRAEREARCGVVEVYSHGGRIAAMVEVNCETDFVSRTDDFKVFARDIAMHVAALNPEYLDAEAVPADVIARESEIYAKEAEGKPESVVEKIVEGKLNKYYGGVCLMSQPFIKDGDKTVGELRTELIAKLGENIIIRRYARFELGQL